VASPNREQLISFSGKDPERYYTGRVKTNFLCKLDEQCLPYWHSDRFIFNCRGRGGGREGTALQIGRSRVRFPMVSLEIFIDIFSRG